MKKKSNRKLRIKITQVGYFFIALTIGVGISALNTGNNLLYLIFSMMLSFLILSGLLSNASLLGLQVLPQFPSRIYAKEKARIHLLLRNRKRRISSFGLAFGARGENIDQESRPFLLKIPPLGESHTLDEITFHKRGEVKLPAYEVETSYPFGLIKKNVEIPSSGTGIVYPEIIPIDPASSFQKKLLGEYLSGIKGDSLNPYGIRDYIHGDPAKMIHWKSTARTGSWKVKEFEKEKKLQVLLHLDLRSQGPSEDPWMEKAVSVTASLILLFLEKGYEVKLRVNGRNILVGGRSYVDSYLTALALATRPPKDEEPEPFLEDNDWTLRISDHNSYLPSSGNVTQIGQTELRSL